MKHDPSIACYDRLLQFVCKQHNVNSGVCKCRAVFHNSSRIGFVENHFSVKINGSALGGVGFMTELVKVKKGTGKSITKNVLLTYDTFASHSTMDASLVEELGLPVESIGDCSDSLRNKKNGRQTYFRQYQWY